MSTPFDRVLATRLGTKSFDRIKDKEYGYMVVVQNNLLVEVPLEEVAKGRKLVPLDDPLIQAARSVGTCFGDRL